ncbi:MAG: hypothetical protein A2666_01230 [Parcubacteria group bacterium RIFCSPHIGHO2_01_FULL_47_10b]|nr:MAG: hypothetical protein A2666_01230 [Parcubacteria group bacterium RIFCSPHIGHO2_01_FULL_47_10b]
MVSYFFDTNIFLRFLIEENKSITHECRSLFELVKNGSIRIITSNLVLSEIEWTLSTTYKIPKHQRISFLQSIVQMPQLSIDSTSNINDALAQYRLTKAKFIDCMIASSPLLRTKSLSIISYDRDFDKLGVKRLEPREILR